MKSTALLNAIHSDAETLVEQQARAARQLEVLAANQLPQIERVISGVCLVEGYIDWRLQSGVTSFAAPWRKAKSHCAIEVYLTIPTIQKWSDLSPLFDALYDKCGVDPDGWTNHDDAESYSRKYEAKAYDKDGEDDFGVITIHITASLPGDTDTCKRVITGYTQEVISEALPARPIYELRCEE